MLVSSTLALSTEHSRLPRMRAVSKPSARDALDLRHAVEHRVEAFVVAGGVLAPAARLAEVDVAGQFAQDHDVEARDDLGLQRRRRRELRIQTARAAGWRTAPAPCGCRRMPCSGRSSRGSVSYCGPPTAPISIASASLRERERGRRQRMAGRVVARAADRRGLRRRSAGRRARSTSSTRCACATISVPMPSPGRIAIFIVSVPINKKRRRFTLAPLLVREVFYG